jgi:hypothetical protein
MIEIQYFRSSSTWLPRLITSEKYFSTELYKTVDSLHFSHKTVQKLRFKHFMLSYLQTRSRSMRHDIIENDQHKQSEYIN